MPAWPAGPPLSYAAAGLKKTTITVSLFVECLFLDHADGGRKKKVRERALSASVTSASSGVAVRMNAVTRRPTMAVSVVRALRPHREEKKKKERRGDGGPAFPRIIPFPRI